jgi:hypothetical protein
MSHREFNHLLNSLGSLSPEQLAKLRRELDSKEIPRPIKAKRPLMPSEHTVFDLLEQAGLIGCLPGTPHSPTDLSTNRKHMEGFGGG